MALDDDIDPDERVPLLVSQVMELVLEARHQGDSSPLNELFFRKAVELRDLRAALQSKAGLVGNDNGVDVSLRLRDKELHFRPK